ncbi:hypothetical protein CRYUN_Cryun28dG0007100 [Craigia yunnanensis]
MVGGVSKDGGGEFTRSSVRSPPIILNCDYKDKKVVRRFKFEAVWLTLDECENVVKEGWNMRFRETKLQQVIQKLSNCKRLLVEWSKETIPNNRKLIMELTKEAEVLQKNKVSASGFGEIRNINKKLKEAWENEEIYWHQKARINWLDKKDCNTRFFHQPTI